MERFGSVSVPVDVVTATGTRRGELRCEMHPDGDKIYIVSPDGENSLVLRLPTARALQDLLPKAIIMADQIAAAKLKFR